MPVLGYCKWKYRQVPSNDNHNLVVIKFSYKFAGVSDVHPRDKNNDVGIADQWTCTDVAH